MLWSADVLSVYTMRKNWGITWLGGLPWAQLPNRDRRTLAKHFDAAIILVSQQPPSTLLGLVTATAIYRWRLSYNLYRVKISIGVECRQPRTCQPSFSSAYHSSQTCLSAFCLCLVCVRVRVSFVRNRWGANSGKQRKDKLHFDVNSFCLKPAVV